MADILHKIRIGVSPLTQRINLYRMGKSTTDALETRDVTGMVYGAVIEHMLDGAPEGKGMRNTITASSGEAWEVTVIPVIDGKATDKARRLLKDILEEMKSDDPNLSLLYWNKRINDVL